MLQDFVLREAQFGVQYPNMTGLYDYRQPSGRLPKVADKAKQL